MRFVPATRLPLLLGATGAVLALAVSGCAPKADSPAASGSGSSASSGAPTSCKTGDLALQKAGKLTVATDSPAFEPWFVDNKPTNGKGYESAVAYAVAEQLGFSRSDVTWVTVPFNNSYAPGAKKFDFDINQISITPARAKVVSFSRGYYSAAQAVVALKKSPAAGTSSLSALARLKLGAQTGTTSLSEIRDQIKPSSQPLVFDDTNAAKQALVNGQVDAIVADLPTAFYISAAEIPGSAVVGQFKSSGKPEQFGLLAARGSALVPCLDRALDALDKAGTLAALEKKWLSETVDVPVLK